MCLWKIWNCISSFWRRWEFDTIPAALKSNAKPLQFISCQRDLLMHKVHSILYCLSQQHESLVNPVLEISYYNNKYIIYNNKYHTCHEQTKWIFFYAWITHSRETLLRWRGVYSPIWCKASCRWQKYSQSRW